jgi:hypothetical protein
LDKTKQLWYNPKLYGLLGLILIAVPMLFFFFAGLPYTGGGETQYANGNKIVFTGTVWEGAFNPIFPVFVFWAAIAALGCYRSILMAWIGTLLVLTLSILALFTVGLFAFPGTILLLIGSVLKTFKKST